MSFYSKLSISKLQHNCWVRSCGKYSERKLADQAGRQPDWPSASGNQSQLCGDRARAMTESDSSCPSCGLQVYQAEAVPVGNKDNISCICISVSSPSDKTFLHHTCNIYTDCNVTLPNILILHFIASRLRLTGWHNILFKVEWLIWNTFIFTIEVNWSLLISHLSLSLIDIWRLIIQVADSIFSS